MGVRNYQAITIAKIADNTYKAIKNAIIPIHTQYINNNRLMPGEGYTYQIDETACCRRRIIYNPTSEASFIRGTKWVIGVICEETNDVRMAVLNDRTIESISRFIRNNISPGAIIKSDGYPSYIESIRRNNCTHHVVNHNRGFVNEDGVHTNSIESLWSRLKTEIRSRRGVMFNNLESFIKEYESILNTEGLGNSDGINNFFEFIILNL